MSSKEKTKAVFNNYGHVNVECEEFEKKLSSLIEPLFRKYVKRGYNTADLSRLCKMAIDDIYYKTL